MDRETDSGDLISLTFAFSESRLKHDNDCHSVRNGVTWSMHVHTEEYYV
jgi:hypothetical protein